jgi:hypothetical protein
MGFLRILCILWILHLGALQTSATTSEGLEVWESWYLFAKATAQIERSGSMIRGVLFVRQPFHEVWAYHFTGVIEDDWVEASHYSGHRFAGKLVNEHEITGVVTTRTGTSLTITARRR